MSDNAPLKTVEDRIVIDQTSEGGGDLHNCYFAPSTEVEGYFNFHDETGKILATGIKDNTPFPFLLDGIAWTIHKIKIDHRHAKGEWRNDAPKFAQAQDGTFQAESGGGADGDKGHVPACTHPDNQIEIKKVTGDPDKDKLKHCYFLPTAAAGEYDLYNNDCKLLKTGLRTDIDFEFGHDKTTWKVTDFKINDAIATGSWSTPDELSNEQNGTFQAESGGGAAEGEGAATAASA
jgi:hypothetical protein